MATVRCSSCSGWCLAIVQNVVGSQIVCPVCQKK